MSIRTTVTLDEDVFARLKQASLQRGTPFRTLLNDVLRSALTSLNAPAPQKPFRIKAVHLGEPKINLNNIGKAIELIEGASWK
jgi:hypothetical protein